MKATEEIRKKLIKEICLSNNEDLLIEMYAFLNKENEFNNVYNLCEEQQNAVNEAREQINNGNYLTDEEVNKEIDEWLKK